MQCCSGRIHLVGCYGVEVIKSSHISFSPECSPCTVSNLLCYCSGFASSLALQAVRFGFDCTIFFMHVAHTRLPYHHACHCSQTAFNISILGWIPCGLLLAGLTFCIRKDEAAVQARLTVRADKALEAAGITSRGLSPTPDPEDGTGATASGTIDAQTGSSSARASEGGSSNSNRVEVLVHGAEGQQSQAPAAAAAAAVASVLHKALSRAASIASSSAGSGPASPLGQRRKNNHSGDGSGADGSEDGRLLQSGTPKSDEGSGRMAPVQQQQQEMLQLSSAPTGARSSLGPGNLQPTQLLR